MSLTKTTVSIGYNIYDLNLKILKSGNYYFLIKDMRYDIISGDIINDKGNLGEYKFKSIDVIIMMSNAQARLGRLVNIDNEYFPNYASPPNSPITFLNNKVVNDICNNTLLRRDSMVNLEHINMISTINICTICRSNMIIDKKTLRCGHKFHRTCINRWLDSNITCPICREPNILNSYDIENNLMEISHDHK